MRRLVLVPLLLTAALCACDDGGPTVLELCGASAQSYEDSFRVTTTCAGGGSAEVAVTNIQVDSTGPLGDTEYFVMGEVELRGGDAFYSQVFFSGCNERSPSDPDFTFYIGVGQDQIECYDVDGPGEQTCSTPQNGQCSITLSTL